MHALRQSAGDFRFAVRTIGFCLCWKRVTLSAHPQTVLTLLRGPLPGGIRRDTGE
jgi:hypothetical protein